MGKVLLVIVFNHKYNKNIAVLRALYRHRFTHVHFLVPFYDGPEKDITGVYENSFYFEGYLAQGFKNYYQDTFDHYLFVADDMVLHPGINENSYQDFFGIGPEDSFIPEVFSIHDFTNDDTLHFEHHITRKPGVRKRFWWRTKDLIHYSVQQEGVETGSELPSYEEAARRLQQHGFPIQPLTYWDVYGSFDPASRKGIKVEKTRRLLRHAGQWKKKFTLPYPLVASYSDLVIVSKNAIQPFAHYCGVFAATRLFVEAAIPTALLLASTRVKTEPAIGRRGLLYWVYSDQARASYQQDMQAYNFELRKLLQSFPAEKLYIHPVKLSKWQTAL